MRARDFLFALPLAAAPVAYCQCPATYSYQRTITVNTGQVSGTQSNFPMLVLNPTSSFKSTASGGRVQNANGYDIVFVNALGNTLPFELTGHGTTASTYNASTGNAEFWVNVGSIADGTAIYLCYGNSSVSTYQGNDSSTWAGRSGVWHMNETGPSTSVADASGNGHTGTLPKLTSVATGAGQIGSAFSYGNSEMLNLGAFPTIDGASKVTISAWVKITAGADYATYISKHDSTLHGLFFNGMGASDCSGCQKAVFIGARTGTDNHQDMYTGASYEPMTTGTWHYINYVFDGSQPTDATKLKAYVDGNQVNFTGGQIRGPIPATMPNSSANLTAAGYNFNGLIDEMHATVGAADSANWILTEYRNQSNPSAFYTVGVESAPVGVPAFTITPAVIPSNHSGNITLTLVGANTAWTGSTMFSLSGITGASKVSQTVTSATSATVVITTGTSGGTLLVTESVTGAAVGTSTVAPATLGISPAYGNLNSIQTVTLTGTNTMWTKETAAGLFALTGGTAASIGTPTITSDTTATVAITVGTAAGMLTITDTSTGATVTMAAGASGGGTCAFVFGQ
jgi:hypothetical protein